MYVETIVEPCRDDSGNWYWAVKIDGEIIADGEADSRVTAQYRCYDAWEEWKTNRRTDR
jgi:hypothetical protein